MRSYESRYSKDDNRPRPTRKKKNVVCMMKYELGEKIMTEFVVQRAKIHAYKKINRKSKDKCFRGTKNCVVTKSLMFDDNKTCLFNGKTICREKMLFQSEKREVYIITKHKIALNRGGDKKSMQADDITTSAREDLG